MPENYKTHTKIVAKYLTQVTIIDPEKGEDTVIEIYRDPISHGVFGIDESYIDQVDNEIPSPFNKNVTLLLPE